MPIQERVTQFNPEKLEKIVDHLDPDRKVRKELSPDGVKTSGYWTNEGNRRPLYIKIAEAVRLFVQNEYSIWGRSFQERQEKISQLYPTKEGDTIVLLGTSERGEQIKTVLDLNPKASLIVIDMDQQKIKVAQRHLKKRRPNQAERIRFIHSDASEALKDIRGAKRIIADKILIHQSIKNKKTGQNNLANMILAAEEALAEGGHLDVLDIMAAGKNPEGVSLTKSLGWDAKVADMGLTAEERTEAENAVIRLKELMPVIVDVSWTKKDAIPCGDTDHLSEVVRSISENLKPVEGFSRSDKDDYKEAHSPEGIISQFIAKMPWLGVSAAIEGVAMEIEQLHNQLEISTTHEQKTELEMKIVQKAAQKKGMEMAKFGNEKIGSDFINAARTKGVLLALPPYGAILFEKRTHQ